MAKRPAMKEPIKRNMVLVQKKDRPDWREGFAEEIESTPSRDRRFREDYVRPSIIVGQRMNVMLNVAAYQRGISRSGYIRRAVAAFIAGDLGVPIEDVVSDSPPPRGYHDNGRVPMDDVTVNDDGQDSGKGYGEWTLTPSEKS